MENFIASDPRQPLLLPVGLVSVDRTKVDANASKRRSVRYDRAKALVKRLEGDIADLLKEAEQAIAKGGVDRQSLPEALARREKLKAHLDAA